MDYPKEEIDHNKFIGIKQILPRYETDNIYFKFGCKRCDKCVMDCLIRQETIKYIKIIDDLDIRSSGGPLFSKNHTDTVPKEVR